MGAHRQEDRNRQADCRPEDRNRRGDCRREGRTRREAPSHLEVERHRRLEGRNLQGDNPLHPEL